MSGYELVTESLRAELQGQQQPQPHDPQGEEEQPQEQGQGSGVDIDGRTTLRITVSDLCAAGYSARQLLDSQSQSRQQQQQQQQQQQSPFNSSRTPVGKASVPSSSPSSSSSSSSSSKNDVFSVEALRQGGYPLNELAAVGFTVTQLKSAGYTALEFYTRMQQVNMDIPPSQFYTTITILYHYHSIIPLSQYYTSITIIPIMSRFALKSSNFPCVLGF